MRHPTSIRLSARATEALASLIEATEEGRSRIIERALVDLADRITTGDQWRGTGPWAGWRITTAHSASSYSVPVLVRPDGTPLGPGNIHG